MTDGDAPAIKSQHIAAAAAKSHAKKIAAAIDYELTGNGAADLWVKIITRVGFPLAGIVALFWLVVLPFLSDYRETNRSVPAKVEAVGTKIDSLGAKMDGLGAKIDGLGPKIDAMTTRYTEESSKTHENQKETTSVLKEINQSLQKEKK